MQCSTQVTEFLLAVPYGTATFGAVQRTTFVGSYR